jgi:hypothetical protein
MGIISPRKCCCYGMNKVSMLLREHHPHLAEIIRSPGTALPLTDRCYLALIFGPRSLNVRAYSTKFTGYLAIAKFSNDMTRIGEMDRIIRRQVLAILLVTNESLGPNSRKFS